MPHAAIANPQRGRPGPAECDVLEQLRLLLVLDIELVAEPVLSGALELYPPRPYALLDGCQRLWEASPHPCADLRVGVRGGFDPCLWHDPEGRLWLFWTQAAGHWDGRGGVWAITTTESAKADAKTGSKARMTAVCIGGTYR